MHVPLLLMPSSAMQVTNLAWAFENFRVGFERTQNSEETEDLIRWGADYLVSAWNPGKNAFVAVVGDNTTDFDYYGPMEEYQYYNKRPTWYADNDAPGACCVLAAFVCLGHRCSAQSDPLSAGVQCLPSTRLQ